MGFDINEYRELGWRLFAIAHLVKVPKYAGWQHGSDIGPGDNVGLVTGLEYRPGKILVVVDLDRKNEKDGFATLRQLSYQLPKTLYQTTPSNGEHHFFWMRADAHIGNKRGWPGPGVDIRGVGGLVPLPPSVVDDGEVDGAYEWANWGDQEIAEAPEWLYGAMTKPTEVISLDGFETSEPLESRLIRAKKYVAKMPEAISGDDGHGATFAVAQQLTRGFALDYANAFELLNEYNRRCKPPWNERELRHKLNSAIKTGRMVPGARLEASQDKPNDIIGQKQERKKIPCTMQIAREIMQQHTFMCDRNENLYQYKGTHWEMTVPTSIKQIALSVEPESTTSESRRVRIVKDIMAATFTSKHIEWNQLETQQVAFLDGVYDLITGELRPHSPNDFLDRVIPHNAPRGMSADCPTFKRMIDYWFEKDKDGDTKAAALLEGMAYVLLANAPYKKCLMLIGDRDRGKSKVPEVISLVVGKDNTCGIRPRDMSNPRAIAQIVGKYANMIPDLDSKEWIADGGFKSLISNGDSVTIDPKYRNPFQYVPTAKHIFGCNSLPDTSDPTDATISRMLAIRFNRTIPEEQQDPEIIHKLRAEVPGIIRYLADHAKILIMNKGRFTTPQDTYDIQEQIRDENPIIAFMRTYYRTAVYDGDSIHVRHQRVRLEAIRADYNEKNPRTPLPDTRQLSKVLRAEKFQTQRSNNVTWVLATAIKSPADIILDRSQVSSDCN